MRASAWEADRFELRPAPNASAPCALRLAVLGDSSSGEHKFKVRGVSLHDQRVAQ